MEKKKKTRMKISPSKSEPLRLYLAYEGAASIRTTVLTGDKR